MRPTGHDTRRPTAAQDLTAALGARLRVVRLERCPATALRDGTTLDDLAHLILYGDRAWPFYRVETADGDEAVPIERIEYGGRLTFRDHAPREAFVAAILAALDDAPGAAAADG